MRNRLGGAGKEGRAGPARPARAPLRPMRLPSLPSLPSHPSHPSSGPPWGPPQPRGTPVTCGAAPAASPGPRRRRGGEKKPGGRGGKNVPRPSGEAAWFDFFFFFFSFFSPSVGLLRLHFPSSFISEIKEGETHGEGERGTS